jgi:hypothetical protein
VWSVSSILPLAQVRTLDEVFDQSMARTSKLRQPRSDAGRLSVEAELRERPMRREFSNRAVGLEDADDERIGHDLALTGKASLRLKEFEATRTHHFRDDDRLIRIEHARLNFGVSRENDRNLLLDLDASH